MIGFAGLSHLGINYSLATAAKGFDVIAFHPSQDLITDLNEGRFPIDEPGLEELFNASHSRIRYTADVRNLGDCDLVFIALDVKTDDHNQSDIHPLEALIDLVVPSLSPESDLVLLSQVRPGFTRSLRKKLLAHPASRVAEIHYQVETLVFGRAVERALFPERYIVGVSDPTHPLPTSLQHWHAAFNCPVLIMKYESAELAKIAINFFLVSSIATTNTLAEVCEKIGADWNEISPALHLDARIGPKAYLNPGLGIAGGNLERDLVTVKRLVAGTDTDTGVIDAWIHNSLHRKEWTVRTLREALDRRGMSAANTTLGVWGLAYKENTHSVKNSPSITFLSNVPEYYKRVYDPTVRLSADAFPRWVQCDSALECCMGADVLVILTPWPQFRDIDLALIRNVMSGQILLDPYGLLNATRAIELDFDYHRLGFPSNYIKQAVIAEV
ncbi:MAG: GDP-mannose dehydrogenase [Verrucomicrobia bacterium]|nr:MAG: GDP-mannose dehydrogenase [Verrucomicrobiota bacterium]